MKLETKFQDEDFELGEVVRAEATIYHDENKVVVRAEKARGGFSRFEYNSIKDFTDHWEDAPEEPKSSALDLMILTLTNFIENEPDEDKVDLEDCKQMLEKLKAWQRLKDKGFRFELWAYDGGNYQERIKTGRILFRVKDYEEVDALLDLLFGGEE